MRTSSNWYTMQHISSVVQAANFAFECQEIPLREETSCCKEVQDIDCINELSLRKKIQ
jgi:hypothetical protein